MLLYFIEAVSKVDSLFFILEKVGFRWIVSQVRVVLEGIKKRNDLKVVFKTYDQQQAMLLPPSLDELIAQNHPVRIVNKVLDQIDIEPLIAKYKAGGTSSFHPRMLLKVLVFAYINNIYSSRKIEEALQQNIHFMWLSALEYSGS